LLASDNSSGVLGVENQIQVLFLLADWQQRGHFLCPQQILKWGDVISSVDVSLRIPTFSQSPECILVENWEKILVFTLIKAHHDDNADEENVSSSAKQTQHHGRPLVNSILATSAAAGGAAGLPIDMLL
jgi:hypothetical protein